MSSSLSSTLIVIDASIKNSVATSIVYIHIYNKPIIKTLYHTINIMSIEAELFAIRCGINQATHLNSISKIIIVTDLIHVARKIFNSSSHPFQKHTAIILNNYRVFFSHHQKNSIEFWECPSWCKWNPYKIIDAETKLFNLTLLFPNKYF